MTETVDYNNPDHSAKPNRGGCLKTQNTLRNAGFLMSWGSNFFSWGGGGVIHDDEQIN